MRNFKNLVGQKILVLLVDETKAIGVTVRGAEDGGVWVEADEWNDIIREFNGPEPFGDNPIFFLPFARMRFAMQSVAATEPRVSFV